ncbi:MAG TPA: MAPEG family protein [Thermohalobaculum sp.]|nr:MAPEG family protein [Thermohalobaculum sp.]
MTVELLVLALAVLLAALQVCVLSVVANLTMPTRWLVGPRDEPRELPRKVGRLNRAYENHLQGLVMFTAAVIVVEGAGRTSDLTATAALVYLGARVLYVPAYVAGVPWVRSLIWAVGFLATVVMVAAGLAG